MKILKTVFAPKGFQFSGIHAGIKKSKKKDFGLIFSKAPCTAAGVFTSNKVKAESLLVCQAQLKSKTAHAVLANSGNANCFVGPKGISDIKEVVGVVAHSLAMSPKSIVVGSTGIIGKPLPKMIMKSSVPSLCAHLENGTVQDFSDSILTTDTVRKAVTLQEKIGGKTVTITGCAKGAGMIYPRLEIPAKPHATMLVFIVTDAAITKPMLQKALESSVKVSFNLINVDGCMSTNDTVLVLANGKSGNKTIAQQDKNFLLFQKGLAKVCQLLAQKIIDDGEGATKRIEISIRGAKNDQEAERAAHAISNSMLFKCAMFGSDPNWGRIVAAIGAAGVSVEYKKITISFNKKKVFSGGKIRLPVKTRSALLVSRFIKLDVHLHRGNGASTMLTCDLTPEYVHINADYN